MIPLRIYWVPATSPLLPSMYTYTPQRTTAGIGRASTMLRLPLHLSWRLSTQAKGHALRAAGGELVMFRGHNHMVRYRFLNYPRRLDDSTVLPCVPENSQVSA